MRVWLLPLILSACSGAQHAEINASPLTPYEAEWVAVRDNSALPLRVDDFEKMTAVVTAKIEAVSPLQHKYQELLSSSDLSSHAASTFGNGRTLLNVACELLTMEAPELEGAAKMTFAGQLSQIADSYLTQARDYFSVAAKLEAGRASREAAVVISAMFNVANLQACAATEQHWKASSRPDASPLSLAQCLSQPVYRPLSAACRPVVNDACHEGDVAACSAFAHRMYEADQPRAVAAFQRGCDGGDAAACRQLSLVLGLTDPAADARACVGGDLAACFRAASGADLTAHCAASVSPLSAAAARKACASGDQIACWETLGTLLADGAVFPNTTAGGLGVGRGMGGGGMPIDEAELKQTCDAGDAASCSRLAWSKTGAEALPWHEKACDLARSNCQAYANALLELDQQVDRAVTILVERCVTVGAGCGAIAKRFLDGDQVTKSYACAAGLSLSRCSPVSYECGAVNDVFSEP